MNYLNRETADNLIRLEISHREKAVELIDKIIPIIKSFDGKVFNIKIENKIREITGDHICVSSNSFGRFEIEWYMNNRNTKITDSEYGWAYVTYTELDLTAYLSANDAIICADTGSKRLNAGAVIKALEIQKKSYIEEAERLRNGLDCIETWVAKLNEIKVMNNALYNKVPHQFREYYYEIGCDLKYI